MLSLKRYDFSKEKKKIFQSFFEPWIKFGWVRIRLEEGWVDKQESNVCQSQVVSFANSLFPPSGVSASHIVIWIWVLCVCVCVFICSQILHNFFFILSGVFLLMAYHLITSAEKPKEHSILTMQQLFQIF